MPDKFLGGIPLELVRQDALIPYDLFAPLGLSAGDIRKILHGILPASSLAKLDSSQSWGEPQPLPSGFVEGVILQWPDVTGGLTSIVSLAGDKRELVSCYPFETSGFLLKADIREVVADSNGLTAVAFITVGDHVLSFFCSLFALERAYLQRNQSYQVWLGGIAHSLKPAEAREFKVDMSSSPAREAFAGTEDDSGFVRFSTEGMTAYLPCGDGKDAFWFLQGPVVYVRPITRGYSKHAIVATMIIAADPPELRVNVLITDHVLNGQSFPRIGDQIEVQAWLQGRFVPRSANL